jgi:hypothetical protein
MAANEAGAIEGCRTAGSAEVAYASVNNQTYGDLAALTGGKYLDSRYTNGFNGYEYALTNDTATFTVTGDSSTGLGRYQYTIAEDQVVRFNGLSSGAPDGTVVPKNMSGQDMVAGDAIGSKGN